VSAAALSPLSIAFVRQQFAGFGGAELFLATAMRALRDAGARVSLITRSWKAASDATIVVCDPWAAGRLWREASFARAVRALMRERRFDIVQSHERIPGCDVYRAGDGVHLEWLRQLERVSTRAASAARRLHPFHRYLAEAERRTLAAPQLKAVICNSAMVRDEIRARYGVPEAMLKVIYSGVDLERFSPDAAGGASERLRERLGIAPRTLVALLVGSGYRRKGVEAALRAIQRVGDACLVIAGRESRPGRYRRLADDLGIASRVRFLGPVEDVRSLYAGADMFVLPTLYDPFPNAALEAIAMHLPVITSTKSGAAEVVERHGLGAVCDALDVEGLAAAIEGLRDEAARARCRENCARVAPQFAIERMSADYLAVYRGLAAGGRA
jgi:UDP-glucose:(heptosyl)LPS alpha-1,3-glucosyltransferase